LETVFAKSFGAALRQANSVFITFLLYFRDL